MLQHESLLSFGIGSGGVIIPAGDYFSNLTAI